MSKQLIDKSEVLGYVEMSKVWKRIQKNKVICLQ